MPITSARRFSASAGVQAIQMSARQANTERIIFKTFPTTGFPIIGQPVLDATGFSSWNLQPEW
jgi:hypothetical protein